MKLKERHFFKQIVRSYFNMQGFVEIDSPVLLSTNTTETYIDPIWVNNNQLRTSPEIYLKRIISRGYKKAYELGHVFRDEFEGRIHLREFSLLEWYRVNGTQNDLINDCEQLFRLLSPNLFNKPFEIFTLEELWYKYVGINLKQAIVENNLAFHVKKSGFHVYENADFLDAFHHVMISYIEPLIGQTTPCVVTRWPSSMAALSKTCEDDNLFSDRFEIYFNGIELANAFLELTDFIEQKKRFIEAEKIRKRLGRKSSKIDKEFLLDLKLMPPTAGIAVGFDRLIMIILNIENINNIYKF